MRENFEGRNILTAVDHESTADYNICDGWLGDLRLIHKMFPIVLCYIPGKDAALILCIIETFPT